MIHHGLLPRFKNLSLSFAAVLTLTITFVICSPLSAQTTYDGNNNLPPFGSFSGGDFDIVSLQNGNLHISIPILTVPQRGGSATYRYVYDTPSSKFGQFLIGKNQYESFVELGTYNGWQLATPLGWSVQVRHYASASARFIQVDPKQMSTRHLLSSKVEWLCLRPE